MLGVTKNAIYPELEILKKIIRILTFYQMRSRNSKRKKAGEESLDVMITRLTTSIMKINHGFQTKNTH